MPLIEIRSGVSKGAERWAADLREIVHAYASLKRWDVKERVRDTGESGLIGEVLEIHGVDAFARLRWLHGVHRVQRPELASSGRMHTSTATALVSPLDLEINLPGPLPRVGNLFEKIRTLNVPQDQVSDQRNNVSLAGLNQLASLHLDHLADILEAGNDGLPVGG